MIFKDGNDANSIEAGFSSNASSYNTPNFTSAGKYWIRYRERHNCCGWSNPVYQSFDVIDVPNAATSVSAVGGPYCYDGNPKSFTLNTVATKAFAAYDEWLLYDENPLFGTPTPIQSSTSNNPTFGVTPTVSTTYYIVGSNDCGSSTPISVAVVIDRPEENVALNATTKSNLVERCTVDGWTYFADASDLDSWLFAINKNGNTATFDVDLHVVPGVISSVYTGTNPHGSYLMGRYWNVTKLSGDITANGGIGIRFFYSELEMNAVVSARDADYNTYNGSSKGPHPMWFKTNAYSGGFDPALLTAGMGNNWTFPFTPLGGPGNTGYLNGVKYVQFDGLTSLSGGTGGTSFGESHPLLPVELVSLTATPKSAEIELNWITASEVNNEKFEVLRSTDAITYEKIGEVQGNGTISTSSFYNFIDSDVQKDVVYYYKLKQIDYTGDFEFSGVVNAIIASNKKLVVGNLIPNPTNSFTSIEIVSPRDGNVDYRITNLVGQEVGKGSFMIDKGIQKKHFNISELISGNYIITFVINDEIIISKKLQVIQ
mgnify:CR=1 FL=1